MYQAVDHFMREVGVTSGRGEHRPEEYGQRVAGETRAVLSRLFYAADPQSRNKQMRSTWQSEAVDKSWWDNGP